MELIDKIVLIAEIEKRRNENQNICTAEGSGAFYEDCFILDIINSLDALEVKEVDLEKEFEEYVVDDPVIGNLVNFNAAKIIAKHFFELGIKSKREYVMTQEEKAKAYDEAIQKVKDYYDGKTKMYSDINKTLEFIFPELAESEDEKIRKALLEYFGEECDTATINGIYCYKIYDWLKKKKSVKWSERDDAYFAICKNALYEYHKLDKGGVEITIEWLESLKKRTGE